MRERWDRGSVEAGDRTVLGPTPQTGRRRSVPVVRCLVRRPGRSSVGPSPVPAPGGDNGRRPVTRGPHAPAARDLRMNGRLGESRAGRRRAGRDAAADSRPDGGSRDGGPAAADRAAPRPTATIYIQYNHPVHGTAYSRIPAQTGGPFRSFSRKEAQIEPTIITRISIVLGPLSVVVNTIIPSVPVWNGW